MMSIDLLPSTTREPNEVIGLQKSACEKYIAVISGKNLVMNEQKQNQLFVLKKDYAESIFGYDSFRLHKKIILKDILLFK